MRLYRIHYNIALVYQRMSKVRVGYIVTRALKPFTLVCLVFLPSRFLPCHFQHTGDIAHKLGSTPTPLT